jgi:CO/xanthine dehydrogenase FAD-binding subunit
MKAFTFERAKSPAEASAAASRHPGSRFIAGGTNLLDLMKLQIETPAHLIDVNGLGLDRIEATEDGGIRIGALVRNTDLAGDTRVRRDYGVLSRALVAGASGQLRSVALGGVAHKPWRVEEAEAEMPHGAKAVVARLLAGAKPTPENVFKLKLVERALASVLAEAKGA